MVVLALETVTRAGSLALSVDGVSHSMTGDASRMHGERLPREVIDYLARFGRRIADVDLFAIIAGPGSFTGLRVGMAAIQGLAISTGRKIVPLPTLDAMALAWMTKTPPSTSPGIVVACLDGQRGEVFSAAWRASDDRRLSDERIVIAPQVGTADALAAELQSVGGGAEIVAVGDGARRHTASFRSGVTIQDVPVPLAEIALREAIAHPERAIGPHALRPIYIRRPDAVLARERADQATRAHS